MSPPIDIDEFYAGLEKEGEDQVRKNLATERIYGSDKRPRVEEWLRRKDQDREDSRNREEIEIARDAAASARDAADAARDAADTARETVREARKANKIATMAIAIAIGSMIVVLISAFLN